MRSILELRIRAENAGNVSKVNKLQTKTSSSASECWCVHIFERIDNNWQFINQSAEQFH